jgi:hypothetical protein
MNEAGGRDALLARLRADDELWSVIDELARKDEGELRHLLRPHNEAGFRPDRDAALIAQRRKLDDALQALTLLEVGHEIGVVNTEDHATPRIEGLRTLFKSDAFLRFASAYLFFAVRFLADRIAQRLGSERTRQELDPDSNKRAFALCVPPSIPLSEETDQQLSNFLTLDSTGPIPEALRFLDDFRKTDREPTEYELWLRGLRPEADEEQTARFLRLSSGLTDWVLSRSNFYLSLQAPGAAPSAPTTKAADVGDELDARPLGGWIVTNPIAARFALADIYWIARLLRADVSVRASVTYPNASWLHLLKFNATLKSNRELEASLGKAEETIRSVFDFVCDLAQNAIELSEERDQRYFEPEAFTRLPRDTMQWREVFDEELDEIDKQRARRRFLDSTIPFEGSTGTGGATANAMNGTAGWSERIRTGKQPQNLIGVAFSGGGIRSATFNLGILQGLQEFDLLRYVDYLSTVSGGGFIGSWLVANVRRTAHWLGRLTDWSESIAHLRSYSNYLSPRTGLMSADTWTMAASWARNAFLIQLTGLMWLFALLLTSLGVQRIFQCYGQWALHDGGLPISGILAFCMGVIVTCTVLYNLHGTGVITDKKTRRSKWVRNLAVAPAWIGSFALAALLWSDATVQSARWPNLQSLATYSSIFAVAWKPWLFLLGCAWVALFLIALFTLTRHSGHAIWISTICVSVLYLELVGVYYIFRTWCGHPAHSQWYASVFGPALITLAFALSVLLFIGFTGRNSTEGVREWWTRFGTWLAIYATAGIALSGAAVFGPDLTATFWQMTGNPAIKWTSFASWLGTVIAGLLAGKSSKTTGEGGRSNATGLELLAKVGGLLFIIGSILFAATVLYVLLLEIFTNIDLKSGNPRLVLATLPWYAIPLSLTAMVLLGLLFSWFFEINIFGLNQFYRNRLVRCYLGASRWAPGMRKPNPFTKFDFKDDLKLQQLTEDPNMDELNGKFRGPFPIFNCTLNLAGSSDLALNTRHSASFSLTPLRCGSSRRKVGYAPTQAGRSASFADGVMLGQAVAISGAAVSSNMGYNTSPLVAFLLTMFNVRLGWWFPNPGQAAWNRRGLRFSIYYLTKELLGFADEKRLYLNVSDGGHFENLGIYELVRRRCKVIIACDAECDESLQFGGLGNMIRICETDFGAIIEIDVKSIRQQKDGVSLAHCAIGKIKYGNGSIGYLIYFKASVSGDENVSVTQYRAAHPSFPHETTANQFFSEDQFESYRKLGLHIVRHSLRGNLPGDHPVTIAEKLADVLTPAGGSSESFLKHSSALDGIWERFRQSPRLHPFMNELMTGGPQVPGSLTNEEMCLGLELIQLMEDVFLDLRLDDFWDHPDNRGWALLFMRWSRSLRFRVIWVQMRRTFGIRFEYFCAARLGLPRDEPIVRV